MSDPTPRQIHLARALTDHPDWEILGKLLQGLPNRTMRSFVRVRKLGRGSRRTVIPDLTNAATVGVLLGEIPFSLIAPNTVYISEYTLEIPDRKLVWVDGSKYYEFSEETLGEAAAAAWLAIN